MACSDARQPAKVRKLVERLPVPPREEVVRRAKRRYPDLASGDHLTWDRFCAWAQACKTGELIKKLPGIVSPGRRWSLGQVRKSGQRSAPHVEPMIMGEFQRLKPIGDEIGPQLKQERGGRQRDEIVTWRSFG